MMGSTKDSCQVRDRNMVKVRRRKCSRESDSCGRESYWERDKNSDEDRHWDENEVKVQT